MTILALTGDQQHSQSQSPFDSIRHFDEQGSEYWLARDMMKLLGYIKWQKFEDAIERAKISLQNSEGNPDKHFIHLPGRVSGKGRFGDDYKLSRYAAYLISLNGDPRKPEIAQAQAYFVVKTREAETVIPQQQDELEILRLKVRLAEAQASTAKDQQLILQTSNSIVSMHGAGMLALIQGRPDAVVRETDVQFESVVLNEDGKQLAVFRGKSLAQLGKELKFKTGKELEKWLASCGYEHLISKAMRPVQTDYIPAEFVDQVRELWASRSGDRQMLIGE